MALLDGTRGGEDIVMLSDDREIAADNLWAIRFIIAFLLINGIVNGSPAHMGVVVGMAIVFGALYWAALRLASKPLSTDESSESGVKA